MSDDQYHNETITSFSKLGSFFNWTVTLITNIGVWFFPRDVPSHWISPLAFSALCPRELGGTAKECPPAQASRFLTFAVLADGKNRAIREGGSLSNSSPFFFPARLWSGQQLCFPTQARHPSTGPNPTALLCPLFRSRAIKSFPRPVPGAWPFLTN